MMNMRQFLKSIFCDNKRKVFDPLSNSSIHQPTSFQKYLTLPKTSTYYEKVHSTTYFPTFSMMLIDLSWSCWLWLELLQGLSVAVYSFADISLLLLLTCKRSSSPSPTEVAMELSKFTIMTGMMRTIFQTQCHSLYTKIESESKKLWNQIKVWTESVFERKIQFFLHKISKKVIQVPHDRNNENNIPSPQLDWAYTVFPHIVSAETIFF